MATPLDLGLLSHFSIIFPILLVYALVLGVLTYTKFLGDNKVIHNLISIVIALSISFSPMVATVINTMTPWIILILVLVMFLLMAYKFMGATDADISHVLTRDRTIVVWIMIIFMIIMIASISKLYFAEAPVVSGEGAVAVEGEEAVGRGVGAFWATIFNPKVIGVIMVMLIAVFAIVLLSKEELPKS